MVRLLLAVLLYFSWYGSMPVVSVDVTSVIRFGRFAGPPKTSTFEPGADACHAPGSFALVRVKSGLSVYVGGYESKFELGVLWSLSIIVFDPVTGNWRGVNVRCQ